MTTPKKTAVSRETVKIGLDFRPIPIDVGDGIEWLFDPDPSPTAWGVLTEAMTAFGVLAEENPDLSGLPAMTEALTKAVAGLLVEAKQREEYVERGYGVMAQQQLAVALLEASGFPTQPLSDSGTP